MLFASGLWGPLSTLGFTSAPGTMLVPSNGNSVSDVTSYIVIFLPWVSLASDSYSCSCTCRDPRGSEVFPAVSPCTDPGVPSEPTVAVEKCFWLGSPNGPRGSGAAGDIAASRPCLDSRPIISAAPPDRLENICRSNPGSDEMAALEGLGYLKFLIPALVAKSLQTL